MRSHIVAAASIVLAGVGWGTAGVSVAAAGTENSYLWLGESHGVAAGEFEGRLSRPYLSQQGAAPLLASLHSTLQSTLQSDDDCDTRTASLFPSGRRRGSGSRRLPRRHRRPTAPDTYMLFKGGGLHITNEASVNGMYLGLEMGAAMEDVVQLGFSIDYFRRANEEIVVLLEGRANDLPVRAEHTLSENAAHLLPIGVTLRLRIPLASRAIAPFISGTASYEALFLENRGTLDAGDPLQSLLGEQETFTGFGWQAAAGLDIDLSPTFGLLGEVGWHRSSPHQHIEVDGDPVDLKVDLNGPFLRGGLRVFL